MEIIDTLKLARSLKKTGKLHSEDCKQTTLAQYFGINYEAHSAIEDTKALIKVYSKMQELSKPASRADLGF
jgi:DNA polymerase III epsilon subunit-like protein